MVNSSNTNSQITFLYRQQDLFHENGPCEPQQEPQQQLNGVNQQLLTVLIYMKI